MKSAFLFYNFLVCCIIVSNQFPKPLAPHILFSFILFQFAFFLLLLVTVNTNTGVSFSFG